MLAPDTGLLTRDVFMRQLERAAQSAAARGAGLSLARFTFDAFANRRASLDAARITGRLVRASDLACRDEDGTILVAFPETDLVTAHVVARRIASVLKHTMLARRPRAHPPRPDRGARGIPRARHGRDADRPHGRPAHGCGRMRSAHTFVETKDIHMAEPLVIDVVSDVVCPWCFIGKRRLEQALALRPDIPVEVRWHPYFLNDWVPREGISRDEYLTTKFGSPERYKRIAGRVRQAAQAEGLTYNADKIARQPNTLDCHRLILWAQQSGGAAQMKQRLMELYFTEGADLTDREVLVKAAADCGMDADIDARTARERPRRRPRHAGGRTGQAGRHRRRALLHLRRRAGGIGRAGPGHASGRDGACGGRDREARPGRDRGGVAALLGAGRRVFRSGLAVL